MRSLPKRENSTPHLPGCALWHSDSHSCDCGDWTPSGRVVKCPKCGRENYPWPIERPNTCSPKDWAHCIRVLP